MARVAFWSWCAASISLAVLAGAWGCSSSEQPPAPGGGGATGGTGGGIHIGGAGGAGGQWACATASDQVVAAPVDIIIAIDQSASMGEEIQGVKDNLNTNLTAALAAANLDYRVIFVAGVDGLPTGPEFFHADAPVNSSDALTLLLWTYDGDYKAPNTCDKTPQPAVMWKDKLRNDGFKVFIVVTDDDPSSFDCAYAAANCTSNCSGCANDCEGWCPLHQCPTYADQPAAWGGGTFPEELYALSPAGMFGAPDARKWIMHSIIPVQQQMGPGEPITPLGAVCNYNGNSGETTGVEYQKLSVLTGGMRFSSCDTDYSPVFDTIATTIVPLACKFSLEQTELGTPDPTKTNVIIDFGDGNGPQTIPQDNSAPCDAGADGWQYTDNNTAIVLCGPTCERLKNSDNASVTITVGCETVVR